MASAQTSNRPARALRTGRVATAAVFFMPGITYGSFAGRIPDIKDHLDLSKGVLGLILLGPAVTSLIAMQAVPWLLRRFGQRAVVRAFAVVFPLVMISPGLAPNAFALALALGAVGLVNGILDVSMNAHAVVVERGYGRPIMSSFHASFSVGMFTGAGLAALASGRHLSLGGHLGVVGLSMALAMALAGLRLIPDGFVPSPALDDGATAATIDRGWWRRTVASLGALTFICLMSEGAAGDWSSVFLRDVRHAGAGLAGLGLVAFTVTMTVGRFAGDRVTAAWGPSRTVQRAAATATLGLVLVVAVPLTPIGILGFGALGLGLSVVVPVMFSAAGNLPGGDHGRGISQVSGIGYCGFLVGPPLIGGVAQLTNLQVALAVPAALLVLVVAGARLAAPVPAPAGAGAGAVPCAAR